MDRQAMTERMRAKALAMVDCVVAGASASRQDMAAMERLIYAQADAVKAAMLQEWVQEARDDSQRPGCPHCGRPMRHQGSRPRTAVCVGGQVTVERKRYWCDACKASFSPSGRDDGDREPRDQPRGGAAGGAGGCGSAVPASGRSPAA
jgi:hypothetical protein